MPEQRDPPDWLTRCTATLDYGERPCSAYYTADGKLHQTCGEPCSFVMQKGGSGDPPFEMKQILYVGDRPFPDESGQPILSNEELAAMWAVVEAARKVVYGRNSVGRIPTELVHALDDALARLGERE